MPEHFLDRRQITARVDKMSGEAMAKRVRRGTLSANISETLTRE
jgi:hypothetical protein